MCSVEGCNREKDVRGLCVGHYSRYKRHGDSFDRSPHFNKNKSRGGNTHGECDWPRCETKAEYKNMCRRHYKWMKKHDLKLEDITADLEKGCENCGDTEDLTIDHDHEICPGKVVCKECYRGILCRFCNMAAGYLSDDIDKTIGLAFYLASKKTAVKESFNAIEK
jgi:hypothetical protein